jgi:hypothetical protein
MNRTTGTIRAGLMAALAALVGCATPIEHGTVMTPQQISSDQAVQRQPDNTGG